MKHTLSKLLHFKLVILYISEKAKNIGICSRRFDFFRRQKHIHKPSENINRMHFQAEKI